jgi:hypothetical protein
LIRSLETSRAETSPCAFASLRSLSTFRIADRRHERRPSRHRPRT